MEVALYAAAGEVGITGQSGLSTALVMASLAKQSWN